MQTITPCLWFKDKAEEAATFYTSIFPNSRIINIVRKPDNTVLFVEFKLNDQQYLALNGNKEYPFTPTTSLIVPCKTQEEIDHLWEHFSESGQEIQCGWITDKFGFTWQIVPTVLMDIVTGADRERAERAMQAIRHMKKLDITAIETA